MPSWTLKLSSSPCRGQRQQLKDHDSRFTRSVAADSPSPRRIGPSRPESPDRRQGWPRYSHLDMLPTPSTSHVPYDRVYEPAEDSFLLLDTLSSNGETSFLKAHFATGTAPLVCEVGVGSGVVLAFVASNAEALIGRRDVLALGTDLNEFACSSAAQTVLEAIQERETEHHRQAVSLGCINGDLTAAIRSKQVDILIFNPPYVPAPLPRATWEPAAGAVSSQEAFERDSYLLELSYAGGQDGMEVTNRLLEGLPEVLSARGVAYVLLCAQNKPRDVQHRIERRGEGWRAKLVGSSGKQAGWEKLAILRIWRDQMS